MKRSKLTARHHEHPAIDTLIGERAHFHGDLDFEGAIRIDGKFEGNIRSHEDGTLVVSETALVVGEVDVPRLILHGAIRGNVRAGRSLQISATGRLDGDVEYTTMMLAEGAAINGRCNRISDTDTRRVGKPEKTASQAAAARS